MKCIHCNSVVAEGVQFCPKCGNPMYSNQQPQQGQYKQLCRSYYQQTHSSDNSYSPV